MKTRTPRLAGHHGQARVAAPLWSTASYGDSTDTKPLELHALGEHMSLCRAANRRFGGLQRGAQLAHILVAGRFVTTLAVVVALISAALLVF